MRRKLCKDFYHLKQLREDLTNSILIIIVKKKQVIYWWKIIQIYSPRFHNEKSLFKKELSINEISEKLKSNTEHTRRVCTELFCQNKLGRKKRSSKGGRPYYLYFMDTFPT